MTPLAFKYSKIQFVASLIFLGLWILPFNSTMTKDIFINSFLICLLLVVIGIIIAWIKYAKHNSDHELVLTTEDNSIRYKWEAKSEKLKWRKLNQNEKLRWNILNQDNARQQT